ncbi:MnhB domain-containing protein [Halalkalicoccus ordinarius]|uniref:MnhB domain-containing protein n=1 Tax=Halalkalicoccus ordinarius TaxID=3116651 RepID=UPI00300EA6AA
MTTVVMRTTTRLVVPLILVVAVSLFVEGHNLPGGGFIGGVLTVTAFALIYIGYGLDFLEEGVLDREVEQNQFEERTVFAYQRLFLLGLVIAVGSGLAPLVFGRQFLTQTFTIVEHVPIYHEIELASAVVFDFGIYCVVVGGLLTVLSVVGAE